MVRDVENQRHLPFHSAFRRNGEANPARFPLTKIMASLALPGALAIQEAVQRPRIEDNYSA